jgi:hypothetical protein
MKSITRTLYKFFDSRSGGKYINPYDVEFILYPDHTITIGSSWPGFECKEDMDFALVYENESFEVFLNDFDIYTEEQIDVISPATLRELYFKGIVQVYCAVDVRSVYYPLYFTRKGTKLIATDDNGSAHEATGLEETPEKFIEYTQSRFYAARRKR